jgi:hypothetical protein
MSEIITVDVSKQPSKANADARASRPVELSNEETAAVAGGYITGHSTGGGAPGVPR